MCKKSLFNVIVADPPWNFSDKLTMGEVKRGAGSQYPELNLQAIKDLPVQKIADDNSVLVLWVPGSFLQDGLDVMREWGFEQKQVHVWVKVKKNPLELLTKEFARCRNLWEKAIAGKTPAAAAKLEQGLFLEGINSFNLSNTLAFGMGRLFRQTHEIALVGTRGSVYPILKDKSQRSVHFGQVTKHSAKPEDLQEKLEKMFPNTKKLEIFARRKRKGWVCIGNQAPDTLGEDIRDSLKDLISNKEFEAHQETLARKTEVENNILSLLKRVMRKKKAPKPGVKSWNPCDDLDEDLDDLVVQKEYAKHVLNILRLK